MASSRQGDLTAVMVTSYPGVRMIIEVKRRSEAFYIVIVILPIALIVLFSFCMFSLSRDALKVPLTFFEYRSQNFLVPELFPVHSLVVSHGTAGSAKHFLAQCDEEMQTVVLSNGRGLSSCLLSMPS